MKQKKVVSIQSLACHGKCSLTETLPILSAAGFAVSVVPTKVLSTHTGGFGAPATAELTPFIKETLKHWQDNGIKFDGVHCGYCADTEQLQILKDNIGNLCCQEGVIIVDPVMGDNGKFFSGIGKEFVGQMLSLCKKADIIVPNITEACFLCKRDYEENLDQNEIRELLFKLYEITGAKVVITGVSFNSETIGAAICEDENITFIYSKRYPENFHGTGDIFASVLMAQVLKGNGLKTAAKTAADFVSRCIERTASKESFRREGVVFEELLSDLM